MFPKRFLHFTGLLESQSESSQRQTYSEKWSKYKNVYYYDLFKTRRY